MPSLNWIATEDLLSPAALTVRAQTVPPNDMGKLLWDIFFPRVDVPSVDLKDVTTVDYRPTADRREWNADGRRIPMVVPTTRAVSIVPIEANDRVDEKEMQRLEEMSGGNEQIVRDIIGASIPARVDRLAEADYRRLEVDAMSAWALGQITQRNPEDASKTYVASFGFSSARYTTAGTAWNDAGVNAYTLFLAWLVAAEDLVGQVEGAMLRLATFNAILADAPNLPNSVPMTRSQLEDRVQQDLGQPFRFYINENRVDVFDDGGTAYTRTNIWPAQRIAAVPAGKVVGRTAFAPVVRAAELVREVGVGGGIDVRGVTIYYNPSHNGKSLQIEGQLNALTVPSEQLVYVTNTGV